MTWITFLPFLAQLAIPTTGDTTPTGLKFEDDTRGNIKFHADMEGAQSALTICAWVKKLRKDGDPMWFSYAVPERTNEIAISDNGRYNLLFGQGRSAMETFTKIIKVGEWYHYCMSWSQEERKKRLYCNGKLAIQQDVNVKLKLGPKGFVMIGNYQDTYEGGLRDIYNFAGELYNLNVFARKLTDGDINKMYEEGICSDVTEKYGWRRIRWEEILRTDRNEKVSLIKIPGCGEDPKPNPTPHNKWDVLRKEPYYQRELTTELYSRLINSCNYSMMGDFIGAKIDDSFIKHFETYHREKDYRDGKEDKYDDKDYKDEKKHEDGKKYH